MYPPSGPAGRHDPLGLQGPLPPVQQLRPEQYADLARRYPALFPPGMAMPQYMPQQHQPDLAAMGGPRKSGLPGSSFILALLALFSNFFLYLDFVFLFMEITNDMTNSDEMCCLSMIFFWIAALIFSILSVILGSVSFYKVKTKQFEFHRRAKSAFIVAIVSGSLFIAFHLVFLLFFLFLVW